MVLKFGQVNLLSAIVLSVTMSTSGAIVHAEELSTTELKQISFRIVKNSNGWFRVLKSGAMAAMTARDVYSLGLDTEAAMGEFSRTVVVDAKDDTMQLISDVGTLGSYVANDVAAPILETGYTYTVTTIMPAVGSAAASSYEYTKGTIIPKTGELAKGAYEASKPVVAGALDYTADTVLPAAGEAAAAGGSMIVSGASTLWQWATK